MQASVVYVNNPYNPHKDVVRKTYGKSRTISSLAPKTQLPVVCLFNGVPLLRKNGGWEKRIKDGDIVAFQALPQGGGGGSNPLKLVLMIAVAVIAPYAAGALAPTLGLTTELAISALGAVIAFAGNLLVNALIGPPKPPSSNNNTNSLQASPTYNLQAQGNRARIGEAIPVIYGRHLIYPDYAAEPYAEYAGNKQFIFQLFCIGQGEYDISNIRIEDTPVANFPEITYEIVQPGQKVTLFPSNVVSANEVSGQELVTSSYIGGFVANPASTTVTSIGVDINTPAGIYYANDDGGLNPISISYQFHARLIDDSGAAIGSWFTLGSHSISGATATPQKRSHRYTVTKGRYEVRAIRVSAKNTNPRYGNTIVWEQLRGYIPDDNEYGDITLLAMRMQATDSLSSQSARRVNCKVQRKLRAWNGTGFTAPAATRSPAWALLDACTAVYGGRYPANRVDLAALLYLDGVWAARGDYFDGIFDQKVVLWEVLDTIARVGRAKRYNQGGIIRFARDEAVALPVALFNMRNIVRNTLKVNYLLPGEETADHVIVKYFDETYEKLIDVPCVLPGALIQTPAIVTLFGVTNRAQAFREGMYMAAANRYRRQIITFTTEMEGFIPTFGNLIAIAHERLQRSVSGDVLDYDSGTGIITLSEPVSFDGDTYYLAFKKVNGDYSGPWEVTEGADEFHPVLAATLDFTPETDNTKVKTAFAFGTATGTTKLARVMAIKPIDVFTVSITAVNEDAAVHTADTGTTPPASLYWNLPIPVSRPVITGVSVALGGTPSNPRLVVTWKGSGGAELFVVESSYDGGNTWERGAEVRVESASIPAKRGLVRVRVAGIGLAQGNWTQWIGDPYAVPPNDVSSFLVQVQPDGTRQFTMSMVGGLPADFAGYEIRYKVGSGPYTWEQLAPIQEGILPASPWESNQLDAGTYVFAVKAVDTSGNKSVNANFLVADLANQRLAGVIFSILPRNQGWPGTKTNFFLEPDTGDLVATDTSLWSDLTTWDDWNQWPNTVAGSSVYQPDTIDLGANVTFIPVLTGQAEGTLLLEEQHSNDDVTYTSWATIGDTTVTCRYIRLRATVTGSLPRLISLDLKLSGQSVTEEINDLDTSLLTGDNDIGVGDVRLPYSKPFATISQVQVTLQNVGPGWSYEVIDKDTTIGPRIKIYNGSGVAADATIDVFMRGY